VGAYTIIIGYWEVQFLNESGRRDTGEALLFKIRQELNKL